MPDQEQIHADTQWVAPLSHALQVAHDRYIEKQIGRPQSRNSNWASSLGHPCDLHLTFWRTQGDKATPTDLRLQRIFEEGKKQEDLILRELEMMGVRIVERGVPISDEFMRDLNIGGRLDARLDVSGLDKDILDALAHECPEVDWQRIRPVAECKSLSPHYFNALDDYDAIMTHKKHYVRAWAEQMQLYLLGKNKEAGLFVFKNKVTGELRFVPVILDLETCDLLANKAKRVNGFVKSGKLPDPIQWRQEICGECPFLAICPNGRVLPETDLLDDPELVEALDTLETLKPTNALFEDAKELRDEKLERFEGKSVIVGGKYQVRWAQVKKAEKLTPASTHWQKRVTKLPEAIT